MQVQWAKTRDGLDIYYEDSREEGKPVLVFQSGYMGIHDIWQDQVSLLKDSFRCLTHDNRGYGLSSRPDSAHAYSVQNNAEDLKAVLDHAGIQDPFIMVTHSFGSMYALCFMKHYSERVKGVVMAGGAALSGSIWQREGKTVNPFAARQKTAWECIDFFHRQGLRMEIAIEAGKWVDYVYKYQSMAMLDYKNEETDIFLQQPLLVLHGKEDVLSSLNGPQEIVETMPNAYLQLLDGVNHFPATEQPERLAGIIRSFHEEVEK